MPPKQVRAKSISSFFLKPAASSAAPPVAFTAAIAENVSEDMAAILDAERRLNSLMEQIEETSSSSGTSVRTNKKRRDLTAPEFGVAAIQLKKITKIGNIILSSIEETTLPILSMRARDRGQKLLSNARKTNSETTEHDNHNQSEMAVIGPVDANADVDADLTIEPLDALVDVAAAPVAKKVMKSETGSKKEMGLRIAESNSKDGDRCLVIKEHEEVLRLFCEVCNVPVHANKVHTQAHLKTRTHIREAAARLFYTLPNVRHVVLPQS